jgi:hypothetical protein
MKINKVFDIIINIENVSDIFTSDLNNKLLDILIEKYQNKCFLSYYIININKILNRSLVEINQNDLNCIFDVCIQFEAECEYYSSQEVILDMEIKEKINQNIILKNKHIIALIKNNENTSVFNKGDKIPIIVGKSKYTTGTDKISINAYPFIPIINDTINYKLSTLTKEEKEFLEQNILKDIQIEEENKKNILKTKNNTWEYFNQLLYPFNKNYSDELIKKNTTIDILDIINQNDILIQYNPKINLSLRKIIKMDISDDITYITKNPSLIIFEILKKYYLYLKLLNDLSITYNSKEKIENNNKIFTLYNKYKKNE